MDADPNNAEARLLPVAAEESERERFFTLALDMLCVCGTDGYFKRVNPAFGHVLGIEDADLLRRPFIEFVHPADRVATLRELASLNEGKVTASFKNRYRCGDDSYKWLSWRAAPVVSEGLIYATARDVTDQHNAEQRLRETATELARSNAELEQFAYVASHDLQEPLRAVAGCVQLLRQRIGGLLDERAQELVDHAVEGATRMQALINDLLDFSRAGKGGPAPDLIDPKAAADSALKQLEIAIEESHAVVHTSEMPPARVDFQQLVRVFQNLIGNAIKFRGTKPPEIYVGGEIRDRQSLYWVRDNGIGIEEQYYDRIFGVFQRLHTRREYPGTGIGLAICKRIIDRSGGRIWIESELSKGTTFFFTLDPGEAQ